MEILASYTWLELGVRNDTLLIKCDYHLSTKKIHVSLSMDDV